MKLYYTGEGAACLVYVPQNSVTVQVTLRKEGLEYPEVIAAALLDGYRHLVRREELKDGEPEQKKVAMPQTLKGGVE